MDYKKITRESNNLSEELFIEHNISDIRTKRLVKEYFFDEIYKRELQKEINLNNIMRG